MREITVSTVTGVSLYAKIYYNDNGTITQRGDDVLLTEQPAGSGLYSNPITVTGVQPGDDIIVYDADTDEVIGSGEYTLDQESALEQQAIDLVLNYASGHTARCDIYLINTLVQSHDLLDMGDDIYIGRSDVLDPNAYVLKYYIDDALVDFYTQVVQGGLILASNTTTYINVDAANAYFSTRLRTTKWTTSSEEDKLKALIQATEIIDGLSYTTGVAVEGQDHAFPQLGSTTVPQEILKACCEIALALLKGIDPENEVLTSNVAETKIDGATVKLNGKVFAHFQAGVPSVLAWRYLMPYLQTRANITLERIDL